MKRLLLLSGLCLAFQLWGQGESSTNETAAPRTTQRFLFLVDTTSAMSRQKDVTMDTMSRLILSGIGGRIQSGDRWAFWTVDDEIHTGVVPSQRWDPPLRGELANRIFRYLRDLRFNKKKSLLDKALAVAAEEAHFSGTFTLLLFTDGSKPVKGTPFDESINEIFTKHGDGMRKAKKPFVIVLVMQDGRFAAHAVSPGGERIYIPRLPQAMAAAGKSDAPAKETTATVSPPPAAAPPKTLTAEEISELLRQQSQKQQSNTVKVAPAPLIIRGNDSKTNAVAADSTGKAAAESVTGPPATPAPTPDATASPDRTTVASTPPPAVTAPVPDRIEPSATAKDTASAKDTAPAKDTTSVKDNALAKDSTSTKDNAPSKENIQANDNTPKNPAAPVDAAGSLASQQEPVPDAKSETGANDRRDSLAGAPALAQTSVLANPEIAPVYLMAAVGLLLAALLFVWLYIRSIRYVPRASIISQSFDREKK